MFKYGDFEIERFDEHNLCLYEWQERDKYDTSGKAPRKVPGKTRVRIRRGYYSTFRAAFNGLADRRAEKCPDIAELKQMLEELTLQFKTWKEGVCP